MTEEELKEMRATLYEQVVEPSIKGNPARVKEYLIDHAMLLNQLADLYGYLTEGEIITPYVTTAEVMQSSDRFTARTVDESVREVLGAFLDNITEHENEEPQVQLDNLILLITEFFERGQVQSG